MELVLQNHSVCESKVKWRKHKYFVNVQICITRLHFFWRVLMEGGNVYLSLLGGPVVEGVGFEFTGYDHVPKYF